MEHMYNLNLLEFGLTTRQRSLLIKIKTKYNIYLLNVTQKKIVKILSTLKSTSNVKSYLKSVLRRGGGGGWAGGRTGMRRKTKKEKKKKKRKKRKTKKKKKFVCKFYIYIPYILLKCLYKYMMNLCFVHLLEFIIDI